MNQWKLVCCKKTVDFESLDDMPNEGGEINYEGVCDKCGKTFQVTVYEDEFGDEDDE